LLAAFKRYQKRYDTNYRDYDLERKVGKNIRGGRADAPSVNKLAYMFSNGLTVPVGCIAEQASKLLDAITLEETEQSFAVYVWIQEEIISRYCRYETIDSVITNPPIIPTDFDAQKYLDLQNSGRAGRVHRYEVHWYDKPGCASAIIFVAALGAATYLLA